MLYSRFNNSKSFDNVIDDVIDVLGLLGNLVAAAQLLKYINLRVLEFGANNRKIRYIL